MGKPVAIVVGVGAERGLGAALCRRFATGGHHVLVAGRTADKIEQVAQRSRQTAAAQSRSSLTRRVKRTSSACSIVPSLQAPRWIRPTWSSTTQATTASSIFANSSAEMFEDFWRIGCFGGFLVGREAARRLVPLGRGTVLFTGASGSMRGKPGFAHFAAAKAGLRMIAQSMAREYGPLGIHVAHVVIDGGIDGDRLRRGRPDAIKERGEDGLLGIEAIAEAYWQLHRQARSAWTQEIDLRPFKASF